MATFRETIWHKWLGRPYRLASSVQLGDDKDAQTVVLLHGLGQHGQVWEHLVELLDDKPYRVLTFDLLGFGTSPKPDWLKYDVDDHASAVAHSLLKLKGKGKVILVGHSMGGLISVRLAKLHPELVKHIILYEMPLYSGLPEQRRYRLRLDVYFKLYNRIIKLKPVGSRAAKKIVEKFFGYEVTDDVWRAFARSLENTIMAQTTSDDIKQVRVPIDVIYGSRDRLVFRGETKLLFGEDVTNITAHTIKESHRISQKASRFLAERIDAAATNHTKQEIKSGRPFRWRGRSKELTQDVQ